LNFISCNLTFFYAFYIFYAEGKNTYVYKHFYFYPLFFDMYVFLADLAPPPLSLSLSPDLSLYKMSENLVPNIGFYAFYAFYSFYAEGKVKIHTPSGDGLQKLQRNLKIKPPCYQQLHSSKIKNIIYIINFLSILLV
jgi:hypothetical protein